MKLSGLESKTGLSFLEPIDFNISDSNLTSAASSVGSLKFCLQYEDNKTGFNHSCVPKVIKIIYGKCFEYPNSIIYMLSTTPF